MLHRDDVTLVDAHFFFDNVLQEVSSLSRRLAPVAKIVNSPILESALVKIQSRKGSSLSGAEKGAYFQSKLDLKSQRPMISPYRLRIAFKTQCNRLLQRLSTTQAP